MKKNPLLALCALIFFPMVPPVKAASIRNTDQTPYTLIVKSDRESFKTVIEAAGYIKDLCSFCTVEVKGYSLSDIKDAPLYRLTNGTLVKSD